MQYGLLMISVGRPRTAATVSSLLLIQRVLQNTRQHRALSNVATRNNSDHVHYLNLLDQSFNLHPVADVSHVCCEHTSNQGHRASTSMYSLTFCVRVMLSERHHWKPAVQAAAVMLRMPAVDSQSPASHPRPLAIYGAQC